MRILFILLFVLSPLYSAQIELSPGNIVFTDNNLTLDFKNKKVEYETLNLDIGNLDNLSLNYLYYPSESSYNKLSFLNGKNIRGISYENKSLLYSLVINPVLSPSIIFSKYNFNLGLTYIQTSYINDNIFLPYHARSNNHIRAFFNYSTNFITAGITNYFSNTIGLKNSVNIALRYKAMAFSCNYGEIVEFMDLENSTNLQYAFLIDNSYFKYRASIKYFSLPIVSGSSRKWEGKSSVDINLYNFKAGSSFSSYFNGEKILASDSYYIEYKNIRLVYNEKLSVILSFDNISLSINEDSFKYKFKIKRDKMNLEFIIENNKFDINLTLYF